VRVSSFVPRSRSQHIARPSRDQTFENALDSLLKEICRRSGAAITLVTKTLVVAGEKGAVTMADGRTGAMLRAYDKATGRDAGAAYMPAPATAELSKKHRVQRVRRAFAAHG
jgi:hypothetical protein